MVLSSEHDLSATDITLVFINLLPAPRTVESCSSGVAFGQSSFTDLDFADDVSLLAELLELLVPILETNASEAASLGFEVNWQKTKLQALGSRYATNH